ncbi:MAG: N-acetylornithine carbamoyltransferase [Rubricoccaceae bacterium]
MNHLTHWSDLPDGIWDACLDRALELRAANAWPRTAHDSAIALVFLNPSLRTRASMELAAARLGAESVTLTPGTETWSLEWRDDARMDASAAEHVREAMGVLGRYADALGVRTFASLTDYEADHSDAAFRAVVAASDVPVVNLESARWHPCQALADAAALRETLGDPRGKKFVLQWAPHPKALPQAVPNSALMMAARLGMEVLVSRPEGFALASDVMETASATAARFGGSVVETADRDTGLAGAHAVYVKAWSGDLVYDNPDEEARRRAAHSSWRLSESDFLKTNHGRFMHCLPVRRDVVVGADVLESERAIHLLQAEYRLFAQMAILEWLWDLNDASSKA